MAYGVLLGKKNITQAQFNNASPKNWLDNSDFIHPIAQAGYGGVHGSQKYATDRWKLTGTVSFQENVGLTLNGTMRQILEFKPSGDVTAIVKTASGIGTNNGLTTDATITYDDGLVTVQSSGGVIEWVALYQGVYDNIYTIPTYKSKGYSIEYENCRRFYTQVGLYGLTGFVAQGGTSGILRLPTNLVMRSTLPTVNLIKSDSIVTYNPNSGNSPFYAITGVDNSGNVGQPISIRIYFNATLPLFSTFGVFDAAVELSADL